MEMMETVNNGEEEDGTVEDNEDSKGHEQEKGGDKELGRGEGDEMEGIMEEGIVGPVDDTIKVRREDKNEKPVFGSRFRLRPYHFENARSRLISEAMQGRAWLVLGWETAWEYQVLRFRLRPYHFENARSRLISEAKQGRAWLVLGWETAWEYQVL
ncbi:unnamed protein product [Leuciscus chuanchicus]